MSSRPPVEQSTCALAQGVPVRLRGTITVNRIVETKRPGGAA